MFSIIPRKCFLYIIVNANQTKRRKRNEMKTKKNMVMSGGSM